MNITVLCVENIKEPSPVFHEAKAPEIINPIDEIPVAIGESDIDLDLPSSYIETQNG